MTDSPRIVSLQVGMPRPLEVVPSSAGALQMTGIRKEPVEGPVWLGERNLAGDGQGSTGHDGLDRAVLGYPAAHYPLWQAEWGLATLPHGAFGENFTLAGLTEANVFIGDVIAVGGAVLQVSEPRVPCRTLERHLGQEGALARIVATGRIGWLYRVRKAGAVEAGQAVTLIERPYPAWTVARAYQVYRLWRAGELVVQPLANELAACPALSATWRERLAKPYNSGRNTGGLNPVAAP